MSARPPDRRVEERTGATRPTSADRGQLLLVGAVAVAVVVVGVAVVLNSVFFTSTVSPQGPAVSLEDTSAVERSVRVDVKRLVDRLTLNDGAVGRRELVSNLTFYSARLTESTAANRVGRVNVSFNRTASDTITRVTQTDGSQFTDDANDPDWTLVDAGNATDVREFNVTTDTGFSATQSQPFRLVVANATTGDTWTLEIYRNPPSDNTVKTTGGGGATAQCDFPQGNRIEINETHAAAGGATCDVVDFGAGVDPGYTVEMENGNKVDGDYEFVLNGSVDRRNLDGTGQPDVGSLVLSGSFDVRVVTPQLAYTTTLAGIEPTGSTLSPAWRTLYTAAFDGSSSLGAYGLQHAPVESDSDAGVNGDVSKSGCCAAYKGSTDSDSGAGSIAFDSDLDTSGESRLRVELWVQEGTGSVDGPDDVDDENLLVEYRAANGSWVTVKRIDGKAGDGPSTARRVSVEVTDPGAMHSGFRLRLRQRSTSWTDRWYVDDVVVEGLS